MTLVPHEDVQDRETLHLIHTCTYFIRFFFPSFCERKSILGFPVVRGQHLGSLPVRHTYPLGSSEPSPKAAEDTTRRMAPAESRKDCKKKEGEHQPCRVPPEDWVLPCGSASCEDRDRISSARNFYAGRFDCCRMTFAIPSTVCVTTCRPRNLTSLHELGEMIYEGWRDFPRSTSLFFGVSFGAGTRWETGE